MASKADRQFVQARMDTTTKNLQAKGALAEDELLAWDSTGSDRFPYRFQVMTISATGSRRVRASLTGNVTWAGLNDAVDALYELSWLGVR